MMASQTVDFDTLVRSVLDSRNSTVSQRAVVEIAFATACYLAKRGVQITLDGEPFEPGRLSVHRAVRLITDRGLLDDEEPLPGAPGRVSVVQNLGNVEAGSTIIGYSAGRDPS